MGDFNNVLNLEDGIRSSFTLEEVAKFTQYVRDCNIFVVGASGPFFHMV